MKSVTIVIAFAVTLASGFAGEATPQPKQSEMDPAGRLFQSGKFADAGKLYSRIVAQNPKDHSAILQLARIALLSNRLDEAAKWLEKAKDLQPNDTDARVMLAEVFYRRDDFQQAAASLKGVDVSGNKLIMEQYPTLNVAKLESFKGQTPYEVQGKGESTRVRFVKTDPLPVLNVRVNDGEQVTFFIDTGGSEVALDTDFAKELSVPQFGAVQGTFSGGQHAEVQQGRIESLTVGDWTIKNLPAVMLPLRQLSEGFGVKQIDGIIGTTLFYHFLATMDYRKGELVLRRKTAKNQEEFKKSPGKRVIVPIWMASDHFMVGWGRVETLPPALLFVDTGLMGAGVKLAESTSSATPTRACSPCAASGWTPVGPWSSTRVARCRREPGGPVLERLRRGRRSALLGRIGGDEQRRCGPRGRPRAARVVERVVDPRGGAVACVGIDRVELPVRVGSSGISREREERAAQAGRPEACGQVARWPAPPIPCTTPARSSTARSGRCSAAAAERKCRMPSTFTNSPAGRLSDANPHREITPSTSTNSTGFMGICWEFGSLGRISGGPSLASCTRRRVKPHDGGADQLVSGRHHIKTRSGALTRFHEP